MNDGTAPRRDPVAALPGVLPGALPPALPAALVLPREFFSRPVTDVATALLGCAIEHRTDEGTVAAVIVETEAYAGRADPASHAFRGRTERNAVMFGPPGHAYVYFTYGMHFCLNLVCEPAGHPSAVLLRAGLVVDGAGLAAARRSASSKPGSKSADLLGSGPARLCQALGIDRSRNGADVCDQASRLRVLAPAGFAGLPATGIASGPRVGVRDGADVPWRFWVNGEPAVSAYRPHAPRRRAGNRL